MDITRTELGKVSQSKGRGPRAAARPCCLCVCARAADSYVRVCVGWRWFFLHVLELEKCYIKTGDSYFGKPQGTDLVPICED